MKTLLRKKKMTNMNLLISLLTWVVGLSFFSFFVTNIIDKPAYVHIMYYILISVVIFIADHFSTCYKSDYVATIDQTKLNLLGHHFELALIDKLEYCAEHKYKHQLRLHLQGFQFYDIELNKQQFTDQFRLYHFLKDNALNVIIVDQLDGIHQ